MHGWLSQEISRPLWTQATVNELHSPAQHIRGLSPNAAECNGFTVEAAPYNDNVDVLPYFGIMFNLDSFDQAYNITTLELDIRSDVSVTDYGVQVFMYPGSYETIESTPSAWTLVANTTAEPLINATTGLTDSYILPAYDFLSFRAEPASRVSIFVTMNGAYLDNTVNALDNSGESAWVGSYFTVDTGTGLSAPGFARGSVDSVTAPKFAGKVHFQVADSCSSGTTTTAVQYRFMTNATDPNAFYSAVVGGIDNVMKEVLSSDKHFSRYQSEFGLQQVGSAAASQETYDGTCIDGWTSCLVAKGAVNFTHSVLLETDELRYRLYSLADSVSTAMLKKAQGAIPSWSVSYVGKIAVEADYSVALSNVPADRLMDDVQSKFFLDVLQNTLRGALTDDSEVLFLEVESQVPTDSRRGRDLISPSIRGQQTRNTAMQAGGLTVDGKLYGLLSSNILSGAQFVENLNAVTDRPALLLDAVKQAILFPSAINRDASYKFFKRLTAMDAEFQLYVPTGPENDGVSPPDNSTSTGAPNGPPEEAPPGNSTGEDKGEPQSILSGVAMQQVSTTVWIGVGVGIGLLLLFTAVIAAYCIFFKHDEENGKCNHTDDGSSRHEEVDEIFLAAESRQQIGRSRSFDGSTTRPAPGRQLPQRSKSSEGATFHDLNTSSSRPLRRDPPRRPASEISEDSQRLSRSSSFDGHQSQPHETGRNDPTSRGLKRTQSSDVAFSDLNRQQPLPTRRALQRSFSSGGESLGGIVRQPAPQHRLPAQSFTTQGQDRRAVSEKPMSEVQTAEPSMKCEPNATRLSTGSKEQGRDRSTVSGGETQRIAVQRGVQRARSNDECQMPSAGARRQPESQQGRGIVSKSTQNQYQLGAVSSEKKSGTVDSTQPSTAFTPPKRSKSSQDMASTSVRNSRRIDSL